jgi:hypothetical protein
VRAGRQRIVSVRDQHLRAVSGFTEGSQDLGVEQLIPEHAMAPLDRPSGGAFRGRLPLARRWIRGWPRPD